ncbi:MAG: hypothetical protein QY316_00645 [Thermodesulfobacteriota bacterium]|nr:MAG: hypothetical protein QY316_00645 [Thermodesulfobacteriota bacterium]
MSFKLKCPRCIYEYDVREATKDKDLIAIIEMQADFAPHSRLVFEYSELFQTTRPLKPAKLLRILTEVRDIWTGEKFAFQKRVYEISKAGIVQGMKTVCNKRFEAGLENHNYLKKVLISISEEEAKRRSAQAEKELREREARLRTGRREGPVEPGDRPAPIGEAISKLPWRRNDEQ